MVLGMLQVSALTTCRAIQRDRYFMHLLSFQQFLQGIALDYGMKSPLVLLFNVALVLSAKQTLCETTCVQPLRAWHYSQAKACPVISKTHRSVHHFLKPRPKALNTVFEHCQMCRH